MNYTCNNAMSLLIIMIALDVRCYPHNTWRKPTYPLLITQYSLSALAYYTPITKTPLLECTTQQVKPYSLLPRKYLSDTGKISLLSSLCSISFQSVGVTEAVPNWTDSARHYTERWLSRDWGSSHPWRGSGSLLSIQPWHKDNWQKLQDIFPSIDIATEDLLSEMSCNFCCLYVMHGCMLNNHLDLILNSDPIIISVWTLILCV